MANNDFRMERDQKHQDLGEGTPSEHTIQCIEPLLLEREEKGIGGI